jgi:hypothetical protein
LISSYLTWDDDLTWQQCGGDARHKSEDDHNEHVHLDKAEMGNLQ